MEGLLSTGPTPSSLLTARRVKQVLTLGQHDIVSCPVSLCLGLSLNQERECPGTLPHLDSHWTRENFTPDPYVVLLTLCSVWHHWLFKEGNYIPLWSYNRGTFWFFALGLALGAMNSIDLW